MISKNTIRIGLFGLGSVGQGVVNQLVKNKEKIEELTHKKIILYKACVKNTALKRAIPRTELKISDDPNFILEDADVDVCIELIGGITPAKEIILSCLKKKIPVITANKHLLAECGAELFKAASDHNTYLGFEAAVCGGVPIIKIMRENLAGDTINKITGILNGTSNYILSAMETTGEEFPDVLKKAQQLGYAEADPTFDVKGIDAAHKLIILMNLAFDRLFDDRSLHITGVGDINMNDIRHINDMGYKLKLIGRAQRNADNTFEASVSPALLPKNHLLASVDGSYNAVMVENRFTGNMLFYGKGAGGEPTGNSVVSDLIDYISGRHMTGFPSKIDAGHLEIQSKQQYYLSFKIEDKVGILSDVSKIISEHQISIMTIIQNIKKTTPPYADLLFITHHTTEKEISGVMEQLEKSALLLDSPKYYPIIE